MKRHRLLFTASLIALLAALVGCETSATSGTTANSNKAATPMGGAGAGASPSRSRPAREASWISLERTTNSAGAPAGPVYIVTLFDDGRVIFEGHASVKHKGTFSKSIPPAKASSIIASVETLNLWERERRYDVERVNRGGDSIIARTASNELPWDILRARSHGRMIRIDGLFFAPHDILALKRQIEEAAGLAAWIGEPHEWVK